jgi:hypothetical protein
MSRATMQGGMHVSEVAVLAVMERPQARIRSTRACIAFAIYVPCIA